MNIHFREPDDFIQILEVTPGTRRAIAKAVNHLIDLLDQFDRDHLDDGESEPDAGYEPWLGWGGVGNGVHGFDRGTDLELDDTDEEDDGCGEPSLGALERHPSSLGGGWGETRTAAGSQVDWAASDRRDREVGEGDDEPDLCEEPSLGWTDAEAASGEFGYVSGDDWEADDSDV